MKRKIKTVLFSAAACFAAAAAAFSLNSLTSQASFVTWKDAGKSGEMKSVELILKPGEDELFKQSATFQIGVKLKEKGTDGQPVSKENCTFTFSEAVTKNTDNAVIWDERYLDDGEIQILISGRKQPDGSGGILQEGKSLSLGTLSVKVGDKDIVLSLLPDKCKAVDEREMLVKISEYSLPDDYIFKADQTQEEPTKPSDPDDPTEPTKPSQGGNSGGSSSGGGSSSRKRSKTSDSLNVTYGPGTAVEAKGSWKLDENGRWLFLRENGSYAKNEWIYVKGLWYRLGADGIMLTGWFNDNGSLYYLGPEGSMKTDWQLIDNRWYYLGLDGIAQTGWKYIREKWYYLNPVQPTVSQVVDPITGAVAETIGDQMPFAAMYANTITPDGYAVDENGAWIQ